MKSLACYESGAEIYAAAGEDDPVWRRRQRHTFSRMMSGSVVADLGCGPGFDLAAFAFLGFKTVGTDGSASMLKIAARNSPTSTFIHRDLRHPLGIQVDGIWSMFALLHIPDADLAACFDSWRGDVVSGAPLMLGLVQSDIMENREVAGWLGQKDSCFFYYHRLERVKVLLVGAGYSIESAAIDTPECYRGGVYDELKLQSYVIGARAE